VPISARLQFVELTVGDLGSVWAFWSAVLNQRPTARFELGEAEDAFEEVIQGPADGGRRRHDRQGRSQPSGQAQGPARRRAGLTATTDEHGSRFGAEAGR
jgi:hypothetical protein